MIDYDQLFSSFRIIVRNSFFIVSELRKLIKDKGIELICTSNISYPQSAIIKKKMR